MIEKVSDKLLLIDGIPYISVVGIREIIVDEYKAVEEFQVKHQLGGQLALNGVRGMLNQELELGGIE